MKRRKVYVVREGRKTYFRDYNTLKRIGSSKKPIKDAIDDLFRYKDIIRKIDVPESMQIAAEGNDKLTISMRTAGLKLENTQTFDSYNAGRERLRTTILTNKSQKGMYGGIIIDATWYNSDGAGFRHQIRSGGGFKLSSKAERDKAMGRAIVNGTAKVGFSPIDVVIHDFWYEYFKDERVSLKIIRSRDRIGVEA